MFTDAKPCSDLFFCPRKIVVLAKLIFISLFLFQFACFALSVEAFNQFTQKVICFGPTISSFSVDQFCLDDMKQVLFVLNIHSCHAG